MPANCRQREEQSATILSNSRSPMNVLRNSWNPQLPAELLKFGGVRVENRHSRDADNACLCSRGTGIVLFAFRKP